MQTRKEFLKQASLGAFALGWPLASSLAQDQEKPSPIDSKLVKEFVGVSHGKMDRVKEMLTEYPTLLNSAWDWGGGDFETGLGAASHVGHKDLASYFIANGAQGNIFTACLFGKMGIVKPMLTTFPELLHSRGPHGFSLLHHATRGGDEALEVKEYLVSLGAKESKYRLY